MDKPFRISMAAARVNANLTAEKAASMLGVCKGTLLSWESGRTFPNLDKFQRLCDLYGIPQEYIFLETHST